MLIILVMMIVDDAKCIVKVYLDRCGKAMALHQVMFYMFLSATTYKKC